MPKPRLPGRPASWLPTLLVGAPFLVRLLAWLELRGDPFFRLLVVDARTYHDTAVRMANGTYRMDGPFWQPPFYPFLLSLVYRVAGPNPEAMRLLQCLLGGCTCWLVFRLADRLGGRRAAWISWGAAALCAPLIFFDLQLLGASVATFLLLMATDRVATWAPGHNDRAFLAGGLALGIACITVATCLVAIPVLVGWAARRLRREDAGISVALYFLAAALAPVVTVTAVNFGASGQPVLVSWNGGLNFWIGNNPDYDRTVAIRPGRSWLALTAESGQAGAHSESDASGWFFRRSLRWIGGHPGAWLALMARKAGLFLRGDEIARNQEIYPFRHGSLLLRVLLWIRGLAFPTGILLPLGLAGMATFLVRRTGGWIWGIPIEAVGTQSTRAPGERGADTRRAGHRAGPVPGFGAGSHVGSDAGDLALLVGAYAFAVILFFPASRYRLPVLPFLLVFAGAGMVVWLDAARRGRFGALRLPLVVLAIFLLLSNLGLPAMASSFQSDTYSDMGTLYLEQRNWDEAIRWYRRALDLNPENVEAAHNTGAALIRLERPTEAEPFLRRVLAAWPGDLKALLNLGNVYLMQGEPYRAGRYYLDVYKADPEFPDAERNFELARQATAKLEAERMGRDPGPFLDALERLYRAEPENEFLRERLRALLAAAGHPGRAARLFGG
jgi:4-amino-4-deoxy-L-arabinose transferase-like glycosyltransferase